MRRVIATIVFTTLFTGLAHAAGSHSPSHDGEMAIGMPGKARDVERTIEIVMKETSEGHMLFEPERLDITKGRTVRLKFINTGELEHEFVMDEHHALMEHKMAMERYPDMQHADANAIRLKPGETGEIVWTFTNHGSFTFGCLIPTHFEAGMNGELNVSTKAAAN